MSYGWKILTFFAIPLIVYGLILRLARPGFLYIIKSVYITYGHFGCCYMPLEPQDVPFLTIPGLLFFGWATLLIWFILFNVFDDE
jgi:hypothetical protein